MGPSPVPTPYLTSPPSATPDLIGTPGFAWTGSVIVYQSSELTLSNFDGSQKKSFASMPRLDRWYTDFSPETGRIVGDVLSSLESGEDITSKDLHKASDLRQRGITVNISTWIVNRRGRFSGQRINLLKE